LLRRLDLDEREMKELLLLAHLAHLRRARLEGLSAGGVGK
jgi:hypothetical protein